MSERIERLERIESRHHAGCFRRGPRRGRSQGAPHGVIALLWTYYMHETCTPVEPRFLTAEDAESTE